MANDTGGKEPIKRGRGRPRGTRNKKPEPYKSGTLPPPTEPGPYKLFEAGKKKRNPNARRSAKNRPPPGSRPTIDPASPTLDEVRLQEALQGKRHLTPKPRDKRPKDKQGGNPNWVKGKSVTPRHQFRKGNTIQPTPEQRRQRPKPFQEVQAMFQLAAPAAFRALQEALSDPKLKVTAANSILDRGYGKATQPVEVTGNSTVKAINVNMSAEEAARLYADTIAAGALPGATVRQLAHDQEEASDPEYEPD
jgi:hypothetical protein